jgi:hypothetical protein
MMHDKENSNVLDVQRTKVNTKANTKVLPRVSPPFEIGDGCIYVRFVHPLKLKN